MLRKTHDLRRYCRCYSDNPITSFTDRVRNTPSFKFVERDEFNVKALAN